MAAGARMARTAVLSVHALTDVVRAIRVARPEGWTFLPSQAFMLRLRMLSGDFDGQWAPAQVTCMPLGSRRGPAAPVLPLGDVCVCAHVCAHPSRAPCSCICSPAKEYNEFTVRRSASPFSGPWTAPVHDGRNELP